jgi:hypothetical protein
MQVDAQRPSALPIELHFFSCRFSPIATMFSGTHTPVAHGASRLTTPVVTALWGTHRDPAQLQAG